MSGKKLDQAMIDKMCEMRMSGVKVKDIATACSYSKGVVSKYTKDLPGIRKWAKEVVSQRKTEDKKLMAQWQEMREHASNVTLKRKEDNPLEKCMRPCEHCKWRMNKASVIVCLCYCDLWSSSNKKAPARSRTSDRRTAPNEAANQLPPV